MTPSFLKSASAALILFSSVALHAQVTSLEIDGQTVSAGSQQLGTSDFEAIDYERSGSSRLTIGTVFGDLRCLTRGTNEPPQTTGSSRLILDQVNPDEADAEYLIADDGDISYDLSSGVLSVTTTTDPSQQLDCFSLRDTAFSSSGFEDLIRVEAETPPSPHPAGAELVVPFSVTNDSETLILANVAVDFVTTSGEPGIEPPVFSAPTEAVTLPDATPADRWTIDLLYPGETRAIDVRYLTEASAQAGTEIRTEIAAITPQDRTETNEIPPGTPLPVVSSVIVGTADVTVEKVQTDGPSCLTDDDPPLPCVTAANQTLDYSITVENVGTIAQSDPLLVDTLPDGSLATLDGPNGAGSGDGVLDPGEIWSYTGSYTTTQEDIDAGVDLINTASFDSDQLAVPVEGSAITRIDAAATAPRLVMSADVSSVDAAQQIVTFTLDVSNDGGGQRSLTGISVSAPPPSQAGGAGLSFTRIVGDDALNPGETWTYEASYQVTQDDMDDAAPLPTDDELSTRAQAEVAELSADFFSNRVDVDLVPSRSIVLTKNVTANDTFSEVGEVISYSFDVTNDGNQTLSGPLTIDDPLTADESCGPLTDGVLEAGETETAVCTASFTVGQDDLDAGSVVNTATSTLDGVESDNAQATATADQQPAVEISEVRTIINAVGSGMALTEYESVGDVVNYEFDIENTGNVTLDGPLGIDLSPAINESCPNLTVAGDSNGVLDPGEVITCSADYSITQADLDTGSLENVATADVLFDGQEVGSAPASNTVNANQQRISIVTVSGTIDDPDGDGPTVGDQIEYSFEFSNAGNVTLTDISTAVFGSDGPVTVTGGPIASLAPGDSDNVTITASHEITAADLAAGNFEVTFRVSIDDLTDQFKPVSTSF